MNNHMARATVVVHGVIAERDILVVLAVAATFQSFSCSNEPCGEHCCFESQTSWCLTWKLWGFVCGAIICAAKSILSRAAVETRSTLMTCLECSFGRQQNRIVNRNEATSNVESRSICNRGSKGSKLWLPVTVSGVIATHRMVV